MNIKILKSARMVAAGGLLLVLGMAATAQAEDINCETLLGLNQAMTFLVLSDKDRLGLQGKLDTASAKISDGKTCDAHFKVAEFSAKVGQLAGARKPKIGESHDGAVNCALNGSRIVADDLDPTDTCERNGKGKGPKNK